MQRALQLIQKGQPVPRGTLHTVFEYTPYDELVRLGLRPETEGAARLPFFHKHQRVVVQHPRQVEPRLLERDRVAIGRDHQQVGVG